MRRATAWLRTPAWLRTGASANRYNPARGTSGSRHEFHLGIIGLVASIKDFGVRSLGRRLAWLSVWSFLAGILQAGILILISAIAINTTRGLHHVRVGFLSLSPYQALLLALLLLVGYFTAGIVSASISSALSADTLRASRDTVIDTFMGASWEVQSTERLGGVQQLLTVNCDHLAYIGLTIGVGLQALLILLALLISAVVINPLAAVGVLVAATAISLLLRPINVWTRSAALQQASERRNLATMATEYTRLTREFRLLGVESRASDGLHRANQESISSFRRTKRLAQSLPWCYQSLAMLFVLGVLSLLVGRSGHDLNSIGAVLLLILRSMTYGSQVQSTSQQFKEDGAFVEDMKMHIVSYSRDQNGFGQYRYRKRQMPSIFDVKCENVSFNYPGSNRSALAGLTFHIEDGECVGIVGRSGSGKTTLSELLLGMRSPGRGEVRIGGIPAIGMARGDGMSPIALVAQEPILLQGSVDFNVAFFRDVSSEEIQAACRAAHIHDEIMMMRDGYGTAIGEWGNALSGGQRQRLAIARALVGSPRFLVLDEPTSALDKQSEALLRETLEELKGRMTIVVISHRLATVDICHSLLVLDQGNLADAGDGDRVRIGPAFRHIMQ